MRLQTIKNLIRTKLPKLTKKYNVLHYNKKLNDGHAVGAEQKIHELKSRLRNFKRLVKKGKLKPNDASRSQNTFSCMKSKSTVFLHNTIEKPYLNLHFKFHDFFSIK